MGISDFINDLFHKNKFICISCKESTDMDDTYDEVAVGNLGICFDCIGKLPLIRSGIKFFSKFDNDTEIFAPLFYKDPIRQTIIDFKFHGMREYASVLAYLIYYILDEPHIDIASKFDIVVPVPLSEERFLERGYNQSALIAEKLAEFWNLEYCEDALVRIRNTRKQSLIEKAEDRYENVRGAFRAVSEKVNGKRVLIVDDIYTHGYTMNECVTEIKRANATKTGAVVIALAQSGKHMLI